MKLLKYLVFLLLIGLSMKIIFHTELTDEVVAEPALQEWPLILDQANASFYGEASFDYAGSSFAGDCDINGDGFADLLIGAKSNSKSGMTDNGAVYLFYGGTEETGNIELSNADVILFGENNGDEAHVVISPGDLNSDGYDDIVIAAPFYSSGTQIENGKVYVILGQSSLISSFSLSLADKKFSGNASFDHLGINLAKAGDINGDGFADFFISSPEKEIGYGYTYLIYGHTLWSGDSLINETADATFIGYFENAHAGTSVAGIGDLDADGFDDFAIGAPNAGNNRGEVYLFYGTNNFSSKPISLNDANASYYGEYEADLAGYSISGIGDLNDDGYDDFAIGAPGYGTSQSGRVYITYGQWLRYLNNDFPLADSSHIIKGETENTEVKDDHLGSFITGLGDLNQDGYDEFMVGAPGIDRGTKENVGRNYLFYGGYYDEIEFSASIASATIDGEQVDDEACIITAGGDINGDGNRDILIGSPNKDQNSRTRCGT